MISMISNSTLLFLMLFIISSIVAYFKGLYAGLAIILTSIIVMLKLNYPLDLEIIYSFLACIGSHFARHMIDKYRLDMIYIKKIETELSHNQQIILSQKNKLETLLIQKEVEIQSSLKRLHTIEKLKSLGSIVGGVAHDFNNLLTSGLGYSELLLEDESIKNNKLLLKYVTSISKSMTKSADLVKQMLTFSQKNDNNKKPIDIHTVLFNTLQLTHTFTKQIIILENFKATKTKMLGNDTQLQNCFMNLLINSKDAITIPEHGMISIETDNIYLDSNTLEALNSATIVEGEYIKVVISDNGTGIPDEIMNKIFEPFVTTKNDGKTTGGTGLGLSNVYGTVNTHNAYITVKTKTTEGSYTSFALYFPIDKDFEEEEPETIVPYNTTNKPNVLIVDDEFEILSCMSDMLSSNYNITTLQYPEKALELYKAEKFDVVILDMIMPKLSGKDLCSQIKAIDKKQRVILSTGYSGDKVDTSEFDNIIYKPLRKIALVNEINKTLNLTVNA